MISTPAKTAVDCRPTRILGLTLQPSGPGFSSFILNLGSHTLHEAHRHRTEQLIRRVPLSDSGDDIVLCSNPFPPHNPVMFSTATSSTATSSIVVYRSVPRHLRPGLFTSNAPNIPTGPTLQPSRMFATSRRRANQPKTYDLQPTLPRLPVPDLEKSLEGYLRSLAPVIEQKVRALIVIPAALSGS